MAVRLRGRRLYLTDRERKRFTKSNSPSVTENQKRRFVEMVRYRPLLAARMCAEPEFDHITLDPGMTQTLMMLKVQLRKITNVTQTILDSTSSGIMNRMSMYHRLQSIEYLLEAVTSWIIVLYIIIHQSRGRVMDLF